MKQIFIFLSIEINVSRFTRYFIKWFENKIAKYELFIWTLSVKTDKSKQTT
jgi:hypothetical protein